MANNITLTPTHGRLVSVLSQLTYGELVEFVYSTSYFDPNSVVTLEEYGEHMRLTITQRLSNWPEQ